jgi:hypothetical protein
MGLEIKKNKKGEYSFTSTISDESWHPDKEWVSEDEAKKLLMEDAFHSLIKKVIEIDMNFPHNYHVNGKYGNFTGDFHQFIIDAYKGGNYSKVLMDKFLEVAKRLDLDLEFKSE